MSMRAVPRRASRTAAGGAGAPVPRRRRSRLLRTVLVPVLAVAATGLLGVVGATVTAAPAVAQPADGQITGTVVVSGAPAGFEGEVGVVACPSTVRPTGLCADPLYAVSGSGGTYTLSLSPGNWQINTFYSVGYQGGSYVGRPREVTIAPGAVVRLNIRVRYQVPSTVQGTATVTGVPSQVGLVQTEVTACPLDSPMVDGVPGPLCATDYLSGTDQYSIPTLSKGTWLLYVGYYTILGSFTAPTPTTVVLRAGATATEDLAIPYQTPSEALVEGTVTITGAPAGFTAEAGVGGCPAGGPAAPCPDPQYTLSDVGDTYQLVLPAGPWDLAGFYELQFFGGQFLSAVQPVDLAPGSIVDLNFTVPYAPPATVRATVTVTGLPAGQILEDTLLYACPADSPYDGTVLPIECVTGYSQSGPVVINTLPAGTWLLYPGFYSSSGLQVVGTTPVTVKLKAGHTRRVDLDIGY